MRKNYWPILFFLSLFLNFTIAGFLYKKHFSLKKTQIIIAKPQNASVDFMNLRAKNFEFYPNKKNSIIFFGDSQTNYFELTELLDKENILNRGIAGDTVIGLINRLKEIINRQPKKLFVLVGLNDLVHSSSSISQDIEKYKKLVVALKSNLPNTSIYLQSIFPSTYISDSGHNVKDYVVAFNKGISQIASQEHLTYIDLYSSFSLNGALQPQYDCGDHAHLTGAAYLKWRDLINKFL